MVHTTSSLARGWCAPATIRNVEQDNLLVRRNPRCYWWVNDVASPTYQKTMKRATDLCRRIHHVSGGCPPAKVYLVRPVTDQLGILWCTALHNHSSQMSYVWRKVYILCTKWAISFVDREGEGPFNASSHSRLPGAGRRGREAGDTTRTGFIVVQI